MTILDEFREVDWRRRQAMIDGDAAALGRLLADELIWTHSSGRTDDKASLLHRIESKAAVYLTLEPVDDVASLHGDLVVHHGILEGRVSVDGQERALRNRFLSVWKLSGGAFTLLAWQSTGL